MTAASMIGGVCIVLLHTAYLCRGCDWRHKVGHNDCSAKVLGSVGNHRLETSTISHMQVPVIRPCNGQLLCSCRC